MIREDTVTYKAHSFYFFFFIERGAFNTFIYGKMRNQLGSVIRNKDTPHSYLID